MPLSFNFIRRRKASLNISETLPTLGAHDTGRRQTKQKTKKMRNTNSNKIPGMNLGAREGKVVPASYKIII